MLFDIVSFSWRFHVELFANSLCTAAPLVSVLSHLHLIWLNQQRFCIKLKYISNLLKDQVLVKLNTVYICCTCRFYRAPVLSKQSWSLFPLLCWLPAEKNPEKKTNVKSQQFWPQQHVDIKTKRSPTSSMKSQGWQGPPSIEGFFRPCRKMAFKAGHSVPLTRSVTASVTESSPANEYCRRMRAQVKDEAKPYFSS